MTPQTPRAALSDADIEALSRKYVSVRGKEDNYDFAWLDFARAIEARVLADWRLIAEDEIACGARRSGSISFEEAQDLARRHAKAEPESYYSEPFEPHLWVINAIVEASATWYERAVQERVRRVKAEAATAQPQAEPAVDHVECENCGAYFACHSCGATKPELHYAGSTDGLTHSTEKKA